MRSEIEIAGVNLLILDRATREEYKIKQEDLFKINNKLFIFSQGISLDDMVKISGRDPAHVDYASPPEYWRPGDSAFMDYNGAAIFGQVLYRSEIVREFIAAVRGAVC